MGQKKEKLTNEMGLRQSKRSVDITASPKKDAAVVEKAVIEDAAAIEKIDEELKTPVNGDSEPTETTELETTAVEDVKDKSITEVAGSGNDDSKVEEPVVKDEKKEKVKKKRSFRSFS